MVGVLWSLIPYIWSTIYHGMNIEEQFKSILNNQPQVREPRFTFDIGHMKEGSKLVLGIKSAKVMSDDITELISTMTVLLEQFKRIQEATE
tara:strand:- start:514 stop:786 length:273 start_codon:yes stop_codon:yes gene_type:complete